MELFLRREAMPHFLSKANDFLKICLSLRKSKTLTLAFALPTLAPGPWPYGSAKNREACGCEA